MAGRNLKNNADYFPHDADASSDEKIVYLESKFGHTGYAVFFKLLECMARAEGFKLPWGNIKKAIYASKFGISVTEIEQIVTECCREEIKAFVLEDGLLYSPGLLKRFEPLLQKREYNRQKYQEQKQEDSNSVTEKDNSVTKKTQSKGKESKEKYINNKYPSSEGYSSPNPEKPSKSPQCPQQEILKIYHEELPELPVMKVWNEHSQANLRARWKEDPKRQNPEWWRMFFRNGIRASDFLMGRVKEFKADLDWIVGPKNFQKIINGRYQNSFRRPISPKQQHNLKVLQKFIEDGDDGKN
jgi:hypothetical protein